MVYAVQIRMQTDTGFLWNRFCPAVKQDGILVFGLLFCKAEKIRISQMNIFVRLSARLKKYTGPFIPHKDTPFAKESPGTLEQTLRLLSIIRLIHPHALLPATTALGTIDPKGREKGILAGANVVMPNLSPVNVRDKYTLYDNKICTGDEAAECKACMAARMKSIGYEVVTDRGDYKA